MCLLWRLLHCAPSLSLFQYMAAESLATSDAQVGASEATLLAKLGIKPFSYGLVIRQVGPWCSIC